MVIDKTQQVKQLHFSKYYCYEILLVYFPLTNTHSNVFPRHSNNTFAAWLEVVTRTTNLVYMRHTDEKRIVSKKKVPYTSYKSD